MRVIGSLLVAAVLMLTLFSPLAKHYVEFWYALIAATGILGALALLLGKGWKEELAISGQSAALGLASAFLLWGIFFFCFEISSWLLDFSGVQLEAIYAFKGLHGKAFLSIALLLWIGPLSELFWRGFIQRNLYNCMSPAMAWATTTVLFAACHIPSMNLILVLSALVAGGFWGYMYMRGKSLVSVMISHAVWNYLIFLEFTIFTD